MRKQKHAYFDLNGTASSTPGTASQLADPEATLSQLNLNPVRSREPSVLSIGGQDREPVPSVPEDRDLAQRAVDLAGGIYKTVEDVKPPPAYTKVSIWDQGVAGPDVVRLSTYNFPASRGLAERLQLPLALIARPFANSEVPRADFSEWGEDGVPQPPPRCSRCRAYMNPAMHFTRGGSHFVCNLCNFSNETPTNYWQPLAADGRRLDAETRPELAAGTYDLEVSTSFGQEGEQKVKPVQKGRRYVFVIDCGKDSVAQGLPMLAADAIKQSLPLMPAATQIALILFSTDLTIIRLPPGESDTVEMLVQTGESENPVVVPDMFVPPSNKLLPSFLDSIADYADGSPGSCFGTALRAAYNLFKECDYGGRVMTIVASLPHNGPGKLTRRDPSVDPSRSAYVPSNTLVGPQHELFEATSTFYNQLAADYGQQGIACDLFAFPRGYIDIANIGLPAFETGGVHHTYPRYVAERDSRAFFVDWQTVITEPLMALRPKIALRCSTGLQVTHFPGRGDPSNFGVMDNSSALSAIFEHDGALDPKLDVHFQLAILYQCPDDGSQRIRVINSVAGVTDKVKSVLKFIDNDCVVNIIAKQALAGMPKIPLRDIRDEVLGKAKSIFVAARKHAGRMMPTTQLLMPMSLRELLPLTLALAKSPALGTTHYSTDYRMQVARRLLCLPPSELTIALYPKMVNLSDGKTVRARAADINDIGGSPVLACDGERLYLYAPEPPLLNEKALEAVLGPNATGYMDELPELDTPESVMARQIISDSMTSVSRPWLPLQLARAGKDGALYQFNSLLVEDAKDVVPGYLEFVQQVHLAAKTQS